MGKKVSDDVYEYIWGTSYYTRNTDIFENGLALVMLEGNWIFIDVKGNFVRRVTSEPFDLGGIQRIGNAVLIGEDAQRIYIPGDTGLTDAFWEELRFSSVYDELLQVKDPNSSEYSWAYINRKGEYVWHVPLDQKRSALNIDFMNRGYYYAASKGRDDLNGYGGWGGSSNSFQKLSGLKTNYTKGAMQVVIDTTDNKRLWAEQYPGYAVYLINDSKDTIYFPAQDSRIEMVLQARDRFGVWKDIEYLPSSWCGNSYHTLHLPGNMYWEFSMPKYNGVFQTMVRAKVNCTKKLSGDEEAIYSNEVSGSINPAQFWRKREYYPGGIMDPYND